MFQHKALSTPNIDLPQNLPRIHVLRGLVFLDDIIPLPHTLKGYLLFVLALAVVCGLAMFQVWTSLRIAQVRGELAALRIQYDLTEQRNAELLWQIGQRTTLEQVQTRAMQLDFHPALQREYIYNREGSISHDGMASEPSDSAAAIAVAAQRLPPPAPHAPSEEPAPRPVVEQLPTAEFEQLASGWQQQVNERWQTGWQAVRQWSEPLLEQAGDFILGQLKQP